MAPFKNLDAFKKTLNQKVPLQEWPQPLQALWWDAQGDWDTAHNLVDGATAPMADAVHAYLHRKEGDEWNANYWYQRAKRPFFEGSLEAEWESLVREILD
jgi:hypothetical protein